MKKVYVVFVIALLLLVVGGQGRPESQKIYQDDRANTTTVGTSLDASKILLKFCVPRQCKHKGEPIVVSSCVCCMTLPDIPCYHSREECQTNCPPIKSK
ncbi:unnamed protein product [Alopecurus aequalis]